MKKIIIWSVTGVILISLLIGGYILWDNYGQAVIMAMKFSEEELKEKSDSKKIIEDVTGLEIREMTEEEKAALEKGEKNEGEIMEQIIKDASKKENLKTADVITAKYLGEIYSLQSEYTGIVEGIIYEIREYYYYLRDVEKYKKEAAMSAASNKFSPVISSNEIACDGKLEGILSRMKTELTNNKCDTSIISTIRTKYKEEKDSKKAYYLKLLIAKRHN